MITGVGVSVCGRSTRLLFKASPKNVFFWASFLDSFGKHNKLVLKPAICKVDRTPQQCGEIQLRTWSQTGGFLWQKHVMSSLVTSVVYSTKSHLTSLGDSSTCIARPRRGPVITSQLNGTRFNQLPCVQNWCSLITKTSIVCDAQFNLLFT